MNTEFAQALLSNTPLPALTTWNNSDPTARFAVYRNNVLSSLIAALGDTFVVSKQLVGEEFFNAMAAEFIRAQPPCSPILTLYGITTRSFADFIEQFSPVASVPYLADVARLEAARVVAYHAADDRISDDALSHLFTDTDTTLTVQLHSSVHILASRYAIVSLWNAHQDATLLANVDPSLAENALVLRDEFEVLVMSIRRGDALFYESLQQHHTVPRAAHLANDADTHFDLAQALSILIRYRLILA